MNLFGDESKYYAGTEDGERSGETAYFIENLLPQDTKERVDQAYQQWNNLLRNYIRSETGLKLSTGGNTQAVPIKISDSLPLPFDRLIELGDPEKDLWKLMINRPLFEKTKEGLEKAIEDFGILKFWVELEDKEKGILENSTSIFNRLLAFLHNENPLAEKIRGIEEDILGAYFFRKPEIKLYWLVIGVFAGALNVAVEDLTLVTLAHEISHAYTHLGKDIDGKTWNTEDFAHSDLGIVEGLAQFYTDVICSKLAGKKPGVKIAYEKLLQWQKGAYLAHKTWFPGSENGESGRFQEVVRFALLDCRTNGKTRYNQFAEILYETMGKIGISKSLNIFEP